MVILDRKQNRRGFRGCVGWRLLQLHSCRRRGEAHSVAHPNYTDGDGADQANRQQIAKHRLQG
jgi:hypothetical protein